MLRKKVQIQQNFPYFLFQNKQFCLEKGIILNIIVGVAYVIVVF